MASLTVKRKEKEKEKERNKQDIKQLETPGSSLARINIST
jgi:hypothetical protein